MRRRGSVIALLAGLASLLATASAASAASIVYSDAGDLFWTRPDGSGTRRIADGTVGAPFSSPSAAPDGTVWAIYGGRLVHLTATGVALGALQPQSTTPPVDVEVSPDGTRLAYVATDASGTRTTYYTRTDGTGGEADLGPQAGLGGPFWLDASRVVLDRGPSATADNVVIDAVDTTAPPTSWFSSGEGVSDGATSPAGTFGAWIAQGGAKIVLYKLNGGPPAIPDGPCSFSGPGASDPSWSPDGTTVAWADAEGVWTSTITSLDVDCTTLSAGSIAGTGAAAPDWSPLDVPAGLPGLSADPRPRVSGLGLAARRFPAATGTTLSLTANAAGSIALAVVRLDHGVRKRKGCVAGRPRAKRQRCVLRVPVGAPQQLAAAQGANVLALLRPELAAGSYELWVTLSDVLGRPSAPKRIRFSVQ